MGRPKTYDRDEILARAMDCFWLKGYEGTSTEDLVAGMGVNRYSLYAEFGSKQSLYEAALERYNAEVVSGNFAALERPGAGLKEIKALFGFFASKARQPGSERGCLLCNSATERAPHDAASFSFVEAYIERIAKAFRRALSNAKRDGDIGQNVNASDEGYFLATVLLGFFVLLRSQADPKIIRRSARAVLRHLHA